jgi:hypothetical protein
LRIRRQPAVHRHFQRHPDDCRLAAFVQFLQRIRPAAHQQPDLARSVSCRLDGFELSKGSDRHSPLEPAVLVANHERDGLRADPAAKPNQIGIP